MRALSYDQFGSIDVLHLSELPCPSAGPNQVLVETRASSINVIDSRVRNGVMGPLVNKRFPKVPGADLAGVVVELGAGADEFKVGDTVFGAVDPFKGGAMAQYVAVPTNQLAHKPVSLSFEQAAALPVAGLAALVALRDLGRMQPRDHVLIHGASGPVGLYAIQIARIIGAQVTAVVGTQGVELARSLGAEQIVDYRKEDLRSHAGPFDIVLNASGKLPYGAATPFLKPKGRHIEPSPSIPAVIGSMLANLFRQQKHLMLMTKPSRSGLQALAGWVAEDKLHPIIAEQYAMQDFAAAFALAERGATSGKVVLRLA
jgi:NADPH:quinone reductase-like Zn-dependent oxidoreductase